METQGESIHKVNFATPRGFTTAFKSDLKETLFPDDPFHEFKNGSFSTKTKKAIQYFVPIFEWLPKYNFRLFKYDLLAGITIASLAIPQGISYAKLANISPIIGLCKYLRVQYRTVILSEFLYRIFDQNDVTGNELPILKGVLV